MEKRMKLFIKKILPKSIRTAIIKFLTLMSPYKVHAFIMRNAWLNRAITNENNHIDTYWESSGSSQRKKLISLIIDELSGCGDKNASVLEYGSHVGVNIKLIKEKIGDEKNVTFFAVEPNDEAYTSMQEKLPFVIGLNGEDEEFLKTELFPGCDINLSFVNAVFYSMDGVRVQGVCSKLASLSDVIIIGDEIFNYAGEKTIIHSGEDYLGNKYTTFAHPFKKILNDLGFSNISVIAEHEPKLAITGYIIAKK